MQLVLEAIILIASISITMLGLAVIRQRRQAQNIAFSMLSFSVSLWIMSNVLALSYTTILTARLTYAFGSLAMAASLGWILLFTRKKISLSAFSYAWGLIAFGLSLTPFAITEVISYRITGQEFEFGFLFPALTFWFFVTLLIDLSLLFYHYKNEGSLRKNQIKFIILGIFLSGSTAVLVSFILPMFGISQLMMLDSPSTIFFIALSAYAIIRHRLMDIRALVLKSVLYSLIVALVAALYIGIIFYAKRGYETVLNRDVLLVIAGFLMVFGFQPLRRFLEKATDRIFAKGRYDPEKLLSNLGDLFSSKVELNDLTESVLKTLTKELRITRAAFILSSDHEIHDIKSLGYEKEIPTKPAWNRAAAMALKQKKLTVADELEEGSEDRELMRGLGVEVLVPLPTEDKFVGLLTLGEKRSGDMYTLQDLKLLEIIAPEAAIAVQNALLFKEKEKRIQELDSLYNLALSLGSTLHLNELLEQVIDEAIAVTGAETGSIMLIDEESQTLSIKVSRGIHPEIYRSTKIKIGEGIAGWVAQTSHPLVLIDGQDLRFQEYLKRDEIISALTVPLKVREKVIGVLSVNRKDKKEIFTQDNLRIITSFAAQAAEAIENARLYENLEQTFLGTISALAAAVDAKDHYTYGHSEMVTDLSVATARELMLPAEEVRKIEIASKLHDIGKIGIDGAILNKPGRLTEEERKIIEEHPKIAVEILKSVEPLRDIIPLILYHHERFDGKGYPVGLSGHAIPLGARILATADAFNAMVSDRPYRPALDLFTATRELQDNSGTQFDPQVVEAFLRVLERKYVKDSEMLVTRTE